MTESTTSQQTDLRAFISPLYQRRWLILAIVIVATAATYLISASRSDEYSATTKVNVQRPQLQTLLSEGPIVDSARNAQNQAEIVASREVAKRVSRALKLDETPNDLLDTVTVTPDIESDIISITATRSTPGGAAAVSNALARQYIDLRRERLDTQVEEAVTRAERQLNELPPGPTQDEQRRGILETIGQLRAANSLSSGQAQQVDRAVPPDSPSSPKPKRDAFFALVISLVFSCGLALILARLDRRIRRVEEVPGLFGMDLLAAIPHGDEPAPLVDGRVSLSPEMRETFRALRTNLMLASLDEPVKRLLITSAIQGEGKSTLARNLAVAYAEWGHRVAVVDADLRRGTQSKLLGVAAQEHGFTSVLTGDVSLAEAMVDVEVDVDQKAIAMLGDIRSKGTAGADAVVREGKASISLLPAGVTPPNPQAVLAAKSAHALIDELAEEFDLVIVDTPPVLAVSDALPMLGAVDGTIIMARMGYTTRDSVVRLKETLGQVPDANVIGVVVDDLQPEPGSRYGYGYGYGYGHGYGDSNSA